VLLELIEDELIELLKLLCEDEDVELLLELVDEELLAELELYSAPLGLLRSSAK
jgi:hypothetical protein